MQVVGPDFCARFGSESGIKTWWPGVQAKRVQAGEPETISHKHVIIDFCKSQSIQNNLITKYLEETDVH